MVDPHLEFIQRNVVAAFTANLPSEATYKAQVVEMAKRGKTGLPSYRDVYLSNLLFITLGMYLIACQTMIPSIKTRKTFPGCVRSFRGFPIESGGDFSGVQYLAWIAQKIKSAAVEPWNVLMKKKEESIVAAIRDTIQRYLWALPDVVRRVEEKMEYLLGSNEKELSNEYDVSRVWRNFLPPLRPFSLGSLSPVSSEFKSTLKSDLTTGSGDQRDKILVLESKQIFYSLAIQEAIQRVVSNKKLLLNSHAGDPFLENACCQTGIEGVGTGFLQEAPQIGQYNEIVANIGAILDDIRGITGAPYLFCKENSKVIIGEQGSSSSSTISGALSFSEETIYRAFIVFCRFQSLLPMSVKLIPVCNRKPDFNPLALPLVEAIGKLKEDGFQYNATNLLRLLQIVNRENLIQVNMDIPQPGDDKRFPLVLMMIEQGQRGSEKQEEEPKQEEESKQEGSKQEGDPTNLEGGGPKKAKKAANQETTTFLPTTSSSSSSSSSSYTQLLKLLDTYSMQNKLYWTQEAAGTASRQLRNYLGTNNETMKRDILETITKNHTMNPRVFKKFPPLFNSLFVFENATNQNILFYRTFIKNFLVVFPDIILNRVETDQEIGKTKHHWALSQTHYKKLNENKREYYADLKPFYEDPIASSILSTIVSKEAIQGVMVLANNIPFFDDVEYKETKVVSLYDKRTTSLLLEHCFLLACQAFIQNVDTGPGSETALDLEKNLTAEADRKRGLTATSNLLYAFCNIMYREKETIDRSPKTILDRVFKLKEREKELITDRLKNMQSDEERQADTILKMNKLGVWSKGLQKGLTTYVRDDYDADREFIDRLHSVERTAAKAGEDVDDMLEELDVAAEIDEDVYNIEDMTEDYMDGHYNSSNGNDEDYDQDNYD
jgi:hypothetical protein